MGEVLAPFEARPYGLLVRGVRAGQGPVALLLHGTAGSWRNFRPWLPALLPRRTLIIPDLPGFGDSPAPPSGRPRPRLRTWARLLHALVAELGAPPTTVIGLGLGASVALAYLAVAPPGTPPLAALVLHTPAYYPGAVRPLFRCGVPLLAAPPVFAVARRALEHPRVQAWYLRRLVASPDAPAATAELAADLRRASLSVLRGLARDAVRADFRPLLRACPTPTLAIVAEHDPFVRADAVLALAALMPCAEVLVQRGVGHGWTAAAIEEQQRALARFLDAHPPGS
jgi:magnesium chelatase accessory protein